MIPSFTSENPRDDRRRAAIDRLAHPVEPQRVFGVLLEREVDRRALPLDVRAGAEARAVPGEDNCPCVANVGKGLRELGDQLGVEGVPALGARQRDPEDASVAFDP